MGARCSLVVNGRPVRVSTGETPLEAALAEGMIAPAQVPQVGVQFGSRPAPAGRHAPARRSRAEPLRAAPPGAPIPERAEGPAPAVAVCKGTVDAVRRLCPGIIEVVATLTRRQVVEPGYQALVTFDGLPAMTLAPTLRVDGSAEINQAVFHIPRDPDGGGAADAIAPGRPVRLKGPVGRGGYRPGGGRLVLLAMGAGFGPVWAIARAARYREPAREVTVTVGAHDALDLYMRESLDWLARTGVGRIVLCADRGTMGRRPQDVRPGPPAAHLPPLRATDVIHAAGDAATVGAVQALAAAVGARCYPIVIA